MDRGLLGTLIVVGAFGGTVLLSVLTQRDDRWRWAAIPFSAACSILALIALGISLILGLRSCDEVCGAHDGWYYNPRSWPWVAQFFGALAATVASLAVTVLMARRHAAGTPLVAAGGAFAWLTWGYVFLAYEP